MGSAARDLFSSLSPFSTPQIVCFIHVLARAKMGGGVGMESLVALSGHALCARFCAEHPIFCFLCPHNNPHGTDEETEAHRGEGTCPSSRRWYGKKAGVRTQFFLTPDLPSEQLLLIFHD